MRKLTAILTGRLKWYLLGLWVVIAVIPRVYYILTWYHVERHWWAYCWDLPTDSKKHSILAYWNWFYVESIYYESTIILVGIIVALLLISLFYGAYQEQKTIEASNGQIQDCSSYPC